jgi:hypothetical protein
MQPHGFHGSGRTTDIAGMTGFNEDDPNALKKGIQSNNRLRFLVSISVFTLRVLGFPACNL